MFRLASDLQLFFCIRYFPAFQAALECTRPLRTQKAHFPPYDITAIFTQKVSVWCNKVQPDTWCVRGYN